MDHEPEVQEVQARLDGMVNGSSVRWTANDMTPFTCDTAVACSGTIGSAIYGARVHEGVRQTLQGSPRIEMSVQ